MEFPRTRLSRPFLVGPLPAGRACAMRARCFDICTHGLDDGLFSLEVEPVLSGFRAFVESIVNRIRDTSGDFPNAKAPPPETFVSSLTLTAVLAGAVRPSFSPQSPEGSSFLFAKCGSRERNQILRQLVPLRLLSAVI